jgi:hypothetical protein
VDGATPGELLQRGIYSEIAIALKGGPWRDASMAMLALAFGLSKEEAEARAAGKDVLGQGLTSRLKGHGKATLLAGKARLGGRRGGKARLGGVADQTASRVRSRTLQLPRANVAAVNVTASTVDTFEIEIETKDNAPSSERAWLDVEASFV